MGMGTQTDMRLRTAKAPNQDWHWSGGCIVLRSSRRVCVRSLLELREEKGRCLGNIRIKITRIDGG